ncbi:MAG: glycine cleavage system aminomethyltransferase GcvT [Legionellaceae bacterium]|nr:glycine cleavage system aminomethyltransferase GcvT [Legionellaceae bacterium]
MKAKTALYTQHQHAGAQMVDFHGWEMPLHYGSQLQEHHYVREQAGMFDVSHMAVLDILGAGGRQFLRYLLTNDVDRLPHSGKALYSCMCNEHGGIIDDLIVYQRASDHYRLILNSACREQDLDWIQRQSAGFAVGLQERRELAMLAVQGPQAFGALQAVLDPAQVDAISTLTAFECVDVGDWFLARTGYTGEDGFELLVPAEDIAALWDRLRAAGVHPCGLGARDTLRLEAGMLLYGQDMTQTTTPLESGLGWTVSFEPAERDFMGKGALMAQKLQGVARKMVGLLLVEKGIMRSGQRVYVPGGEDGVITSGGFSPTLQQSIALARVPASCPEAVQVEIRGKMIPARLVKPRFVKNGKKLV